MITFAVENDETPFAHKGMQQTFKAKVTNLLQEKLEAQGASDEWSDMNESEHSDKRFDFFAQNKQ